ncbi:MAG: hypothetical protein NUW37_07425 [Planctomycetes bacterium]|nr:hypothetical protein [Planctomycetota bacterium]
MFSLVINKVSSRDKFESAKHELSRNLPVDPDTAERILGSAPLILFTNIPEDELELLQGSMLRMSKAGIEVNLTSAPDDSLVAVNWPEGLNHTLLLGEEEETSGNGQEPAAPEKKDSGSTRVQPPAGIPTSKVSRRCQAVCPGCGELIQVQVPLSLGVNAPPEARPGAPSQLPATLMGKDRSTICPMCGDRFGVEFPAELDTAPSPAKSGSFFEGPAKPITGRALAMTKAEIDDIEDLEEDEDAMVENITGGSAVFSKVLDESDEPAPAARSSKIDSGEFNSFEDFEEVDTVSRSTSDAEVPVVTRTQSDAVIDSAPVIDEEEFFPQDLIAPSEPEVAETFLLDNSQDDEEEDDLEEMEELEDEEDYFEEEEVKPEPKRKSLFPDEIKLVGEAASKGDHFDQELKLKDAISGMDTTVNVVDLSAFGIAPSENKQDTLAFDLGVDFSDLDALAPKKPEPKAPEPAPATLGAAVTLGMTGKKTSEPEPLVKPKKKKKQTSAIEAPAEASAKAAVASAPAAIASPDTDDGKAAPDLFSEDELSDLEYSESGGAIATALPVTPAMTGAPVPPPDSAAQVAEAIVPEAIEVMPAELDEVDSLVDLVDDEEMDALEAIMSSNYKLPSERDEAPKAAAVADPVEVEAAFAIAEIEEDDDESIISAAVAFDEDEEEDEVIAAIIEDDDEAEVAMAAIEDDAVSGMDDYDDAMSVIEVEAEEVVEAVEAFAEELEGADGIAGLGDYDIDINAFASPSQTGEAEIAPKKQDAQPPRGFAMGDFDLSEDDFDAEMEAFEESGTFEDSPVETHSGGEPDLEPWTVSARNYSDPQINVRRGRSPLLEISDGAQLDFKKSESGEHFVAKQVDQQAKPEEPREDDTLKPWTGSARAYAHGKPPPKREVQYQAQSPEGKKAAQPVAKKQVQQPAQPQQPAAKKQIPQVAQPQQPAAKKHAAIPVAPPAQKEEKKKKKKTAPHAALEIEEEIEVELTPPAKAGAAKPGIAKVGKKSTGKKVEPAPEPLEAMDDDIEIESEEDEIEIKGKSKKTKRVPPALELKTKKKDTSVKKKKKDKSEKKKKTDEPEELQFEVADDEDDWMPSDGGGDLEAGDENGPAPGDTAFLSVEDILSAKDLGALVKPVEDEEEKDPFADGIDSVDEFDLGADDDGEPKEPEPKTKAKAPPAAPPVGLAKTPEDSGSVKLLSGEEADEMSLDLDADEPQESFKPSGASSSAASGDGGFNLFLSKIPSDKQGQAVDLMVNELSMAKDKAQSLVKRSVIPLLKDVQKDEAEEILAKFRKLRFSGRITKVSK